MHKTTFLGVMFDDILKWNDQIDQVRCKLSKTISVLRKANCLLQGQALFMLYNSLFLPYLSYCAEVWANTYKSRLNPIVVIQKRAIRIILEACRLTHTNDLFKKLYTLKFLDLVQYKCGLIMYRAFHNKLPLNLQRLFKIGDAVKYTTRQSKKFRVKYRRTNVMEHCISIAGTKIWNELPVNVVESKSIFVFKKQLKAYFISKY